MDSRQLPKLLLIASLVVLCATSVGMAVSAQDNGATATSVFADQHTENVSNVTATGGNGKAKLNDSSADRSDGDATEGGNGKSKEDDSEPESNDEDAAAGGNGKAKLEAPDNLTVSAPSFGEVPVGDTVVEEVQITNQGETSVTVEQVEIVGQDAGAFEVTEAEVPLEIGPGETVEVSVAFTPDEAGEMTAQMQITSGSGDIVEVTLTGEGVPPETDDSPAPPPSEDTDTDSPDDTETPDTDTPDTDTPDESGGPPDTDTDTPDTETTTEGPDQPPTTTTTTTTEEPDQPPTTTTTTEEPDQPPTTTTTTEEPDQPPTTTTTTEEPDQPPTTTTTTEEPDQPPEPAADLELTKSVNRSTLSTGSNVAYTVTVGNNGPNATSGVTVEDTLPDGVTFVSADATQGSYNDTTGLWTIGELEVDQEVELTIVATANSAENVTNVAEVNSSDIDDPDSTPNNDDPDEDDQDTVTVDGQEADLGVTKTVNDINATVGDNVTFTVNVTNNGPDTATGVSVIESLNSGLTYQSAETTQGTYNEDTNVYEVGTLDSGETATLTLTALIESVEDTSNAVAVTGDLPDPDPGNNTNTSDPNPAVADLSLTKNVNASTPDVGDNVAFTIDLTNNGPNATSNVSVEDALPDGLSFVSADASQGSYDAETGLWSVGSLTPNEESTLTVVTTVESSENITNVAQVNGSDVYDPDSTPDNDQSGEDDQDSVTIDGQQADLAVSKTVDDSNATVGDDVVFTIDVTNNGPDTATNVSVYETLDSGLSFVSAETTQGEYSPDTSVYSVGTLETSETATLTLTATIESVENTTNTVTVTGDPPDPNDSNNNNSSDPDPDVADLALTKTVNTTENVTVGDTVEFTVGVTNNGPDTATNVTVNEYPGEGLSFVSAETTQGSYDNGTGVYDVGTLEDGSSATLMIVSTITSANDTANFVNATSDQPPPDETPPPNNTTDPNPKVADLELTKDVNESSPDVGDNIEYTIDLANNGPNATSNVTVEDALLDGVTFVSASATQGSYDADTGIWSVGDLANGDETTLTVVATVETSENITNTAQVNTSDVYDPDSTPGNDVPEEDDQDTVTIDGQLADLAVSKTVEDSNVTVGDDVEFNVTVRNNGPDTATNVSAYETLDSGLSFVSAETTQGEYNEATSVYDVGTLANGETATLTLTATIESAENTTNTVRVTGPPPDPNDPNNNNSSEPNPEVADLELTKDVNESSPNVGDNIEYTVDLTNEGPNATSNVTVEDALPEGVTFVSASASEGSYDDSSGTWTVGDLATGDSSTLTIVASVESGENVTNTAQVNSSEVYDPDSTPGNNESSEDDQDNATLNGQQADLSLTKTVNATENVTVGDTVEFTVGVTNNGPDTATNVTVNEYPGEGLSFESAEVTQGSYDSGTGVYDVGTLEDGESATLTIVSTITSPNDTANFVNATTDQPPPLTPPPLTPPPNNTTNPNPKVADLELTKSVNESAPNVGENVEFTIDLTNEGPNATSNVTVEDALPEGVTFVSSSATQGSYDDSSGTWSIGELANGDESTLTLVASVESTENVTNTAQVNSSDLFDPDSTPANSEPGEDDQDNATLNGQQADLSLTKTVNATENVTVGDTVEFTVGVTNNGPDTATNVTVNEYPGEGLSFESAEVTQGSYDSGTGVYDVGTLEDGESATLTIVSTITSPNDTANFVNATTDQPPPLTPPPNNTTNPNPKVADLELTKDVNATTPTVGDNVAFTIDLTNTGPNATSNVSVTDELPDGVSFVSADATQGSYDNSTGSWTVGELATGDSSTLTLVGTVESTENVTNVAQVTSSDLSDPDSTPNNNESSEDDQDSATVTAQEQEVADLELTKTVNESAPTVGDNIAFTIDLTNTGPNATSNVSVEDVLPDNVTFVSADATQGSYDNGTGSWTVGELADGDSSTLTIVASVESAGDITNIAQVDSSELLDPDSTPANDVSAEDDQDSATLTAQEQTVDLEVSKSVDDDMTGPGYNQTFTVDVTNNGSNTATNVLVEDRYDDLLSIVSSDTTQGSFDESSGEFSIASLAPGETATVTYTAQSTDTYGSRTAAEVMSVDQTDVDSTPRNNDPTEDDQDSVASGAQPIFRGANVNIETESAAPFQPASLTLTFTAGNADGTEFDQDNILVAGIDRGTDDNRFIVDEDYTGTVTSTSGDANSFTISYSGFGVLGNGDQASVGLKQYDRTDNAGEIYDSNQPPGTDQSADQVADGVGGGQLTSTYDFPLNDKRSAILSDNSDYFNESENPFVFQGDLGAAGSYELVSSNVGSSSATVSAASLPVASSPISSTASQNTTNETTTTTPTMTETTSNNSSNTTTEMPTTTTETSTETATTETETPTDEPTDTATETVDTTTKTATTTENTTTAPTTEASPTTAETPTATENETSTETTETSTEATESATTTVNTTTAPSDATETSADDNNTTAAP